MVASAPKVARLARGKAPIGLRPCREVFCGPPLGSSLSKCRHLLSLAPTKRPVPARKHRGLPPKVLPGYCKFSISCFSGKARTIPDPSDRTEDLCAESYEIETAPSSAKVCAYSVKRVHIERRQIQNRGTTPGARRRANASRTRCARDLPTEWIGRRSDVSPTRGRRGPRPREERGDRRELVARSAKAVDHRGERLHEPLRCARGSLGVVQVHDGAGVSAAEDAIHLVLGRHWSQPLGLDRPEDAPLAEAAEGAEHRRVH